jgi:hypothetical protein
MKAAVKGIAQYAIGGAVLLAIWVGIAAVVVITARPIAPRQTPAPLEDKLNLLDGFRFSEACMAEIQAVPQKMLDYWSKWRLPKPEGTTSTTHQYCA